MQQSTVNLNTKSGQIHSLHVGGTSLFVTRIDLNQINQIFKRQFIKNFVLDESLFGNQLDHPFYQRVTIQQISNLPDKQLSSHFLGYILKLQDTERVEVKTLTIPLIELEISSHRKAIQFCQSLQSDQVFQVMPTAKTNGNIKELNRFISWIEQGQAPLNIKFYKKPYDLDSIDWDDWVSLESYDQPIYEQNKSQNDSPLISVIIPHYESQYFISNVLMHLSNIDRYDQIEVLVIDDGSKVSSLQYIQYTAQRLFPHLNLKIFKWKEPSKLKTDEKIFRAGNSRNWGAQMAQASRLFFLDADILVPKNIVSRIEKSLEDSDVVQYKRLHIPFDLSNETSEYDSLISNQRLFIEESDYWSQLFNSDDWMEVSDHWKMTCTYALAIDKSLFNQLGRFRRNFIRYGFEDTDLGYRMYKNNCRFFLDQTPLLHLTQSQENTQSFIYKLKKMNRIQKMAKVFYLSNLDPKIYQLFHSFY